MKNHWLEAANNKNAPQEIVNKLPKSKQQQIATPFFTAKIVDVKDPYKQGRLKVQLTPAIATYFGNGKGTSMWAVPVSTFAGSNLTAIPGPALVGAKAVLFKDKKGILYYVGVKRPVFSPGACALP
tara:strand:+ start:4461 stop:4838 length:378 start_codon:yes stop_codon:yes gene_type:complete